MHHDRSYLLFALFRSVDHVRSSGEIMLDPLERDCNSACDQSPEYGTAVHLLDSGHQPDSPKSFY